MQKSLESLSLELSRALSPLRGKISSFDQYLNFMLTELGWNVDSLPPPVQNLSSDIDNLVNQIKDIGEADVSPNRLIDIIAALFRLFRDIDAVRNLPPGSISPALQQEGFLSTFPKELVDFLLIDFLRQYYPLEYTLLKSLGILTEESAGNTSARPIHTKRTIQWKNFTAILDNPHGVLKTVYGWGTQNFDSLHLANNLSGFLSALGFTVYLEEMDDAIAMALEEKSDPDPDLIKYYLKIPFSTDSDDPLSATFGISIFPLPQKGVQLPGFAIIPYGTENFDGSRKISDNISLSFQTSLKIASGIGIIIKPDEDIRIISGFSGGTSAGPVTGGMKAGLLFTRANNSPIRIFTISESKYLEIQSIGIFLGADLQTSDRKDLYTELELRGGRLQIGTDETDGFLSSILPPDGIKATFDLILGLSVLRGVYFRGSGGLEIQIPAHIQVGAVEIQAVTLSAMPKSGAIPIGIGADVKAALGPLQVTVKEVGLSINLSFPDQGGNLGPLDVDVGFKPPKGVGLSVDAGVIKGGGFLSFDPEKGEYAGALELVIAGWINAKAIGLINTRMPDGSKGFSLLIIITAEFQPGLQLGYGFVLLGVGGLLGLNRTMNLQALMEGVRTGAIESIMFPKDVVANAPRIISDLKTVFPPQEGLFLVGPMAKVGWGTPTLISISLGVIIELPRPTIAIVGILKIALPHEKAPLLVLQVNFAGGLEPDKKRLYFYACLFESRVLYYTIDGSMGLLMAWGDDANFLVSVGGFHPQYNPPPLPFPNPDRIVLAILDSSHARIRFSSYYAVTSNTVQFGSNNELYFGFSACNLSGHNAFDALIQFSPFYFIVQISCEISLKVFGMGLFSIGLQFSLEGPTPWRAVGSGEISFFFFSISVDFDITWGESRDTSLPPVQVLPILREEFSKAENWSALIPGNCNLLVSLRTLEPDASTLVLYPMGTLQISQKAVPLDITLDKVGNQKVEDGNKFWVAVSTNDFAKDSDTREMFALAQFQEMSGTEKLSCTAYQRMNSGVEISFKGTQKINSYQVTKRVLRYETVIIDSNYKRFITLFASILGNLFNSLLGANAAALCALSMTTLKQHQPFEEKIEILPDYYTVAVSSTNKPFQPGTTKFESQVSANEFIRTMSRSDPKTAAQLHVIPNTEVNA